MLLSILTQSGMSTSQKLMYILIIAFCVLLSLSVHELSHGLAAYVMGDKTAKYSGRLSLNPLHHLDPFGALCLFLFGFGWAKPVPINPWSFRNKKGGMALTALAGPISNFLLAFIAEIGVVILSSIRFASGTSFVFNLASVCYILCTYLAMTNIGLGLFNLIPVPPLDGSKVLNAILPQRLYFKIMDYERYGFIILIILINIPAFNGLLALARGGILGAYDSLISMVINLFA